MGDRAQAGLSATPVGPVIKHGPLRKLKGMKKKYFVLRGEDGANSARLEYYDSEKKWRGGAPPKRAIPVRSCFNIQRRLDTKHKHALALYTREECLCVVLDSEEEVAAWLRPLLALLHGEPAQPSQPDERHPRQHVWQVNVQKKGLGASRNILGLYNLCLTDKVLSLVKIRPDTSVVITEPLEFPLVCIRRCGDSECFFYMEVGRSACTGAGELWMHTEDPNIAQSMHATILNAMSSKSTSVSKDELGPKSRNRSSSANEASKPISALTRRQTHAGSKSHGLSPSSENTFCGGRSCVGLCISPCVTASAAYNVSQDVELPLYEGTDHKPDDSNNDLDVNGHPIVCKPPLDGIHALNVVHERTRSLPLTGEETNVNISNELRCLIEKKTSINLSMEKMKPYKQNDVILLCNKLSHKSQMWGRRASTGCRVVKWLPSHSCSGSVGTASGVRERCDSLPSRANAAVSTPRVNITPIGASRLSTALRPHSMFVHTISQSPPVVGNSPLSPNSGAYSTDSAGSSMSIDETDSFGHHGLTDEINHHLVGRFNNSLTPKDQTIPEEGADETLSVWQPAKSLIDTVDGSSPVPIVGSPMDGEYIPMSPGSVEPFRMLNSFVNAHSANHSRTSSLAEETNVENTLQLPSNKTEDGYVDMEPAKKDNSHTMSPAGSVCSVTSGTPSTDIRFSEFHLEKVSSYFTHSEEDDENRPARAYSVGSRPDHLKKIFARPETVHMGIGILDSSRTRAFSVGSHYKHKDNRILNHGTPPHHHLHHLPGYSHSTNKSSSAPLLAGTSQTNTPSRQFGNSGFSSAEPDDLMEMDFTNRTASFSKNFKKNADSIQHSTSVQSSLCSPSISITNKNISEGYMDMSPINTSTLGYVEMKPVEPNSSGSSTPKMLSSVMRKASITKSPPVTSCQQVPIQPSTPEGYVDMSWNNGKSQIRNRVSSLPISINNDSKKDAVSSGSGVSSASPIFSSSLPKCEEEIKKNIPKTSESGSLLHNSIAGYRKHSIKLQMRRNSKELLNQSENTQYATAPLTLNINNPASPMKPNSSKSRVEMDDITERKCSIDASSGTLKLFNMPQMLKECSLSDGGNDPNLNYMEMNPNRLSTVKEMSEVSLNKVGVDKDMKQFINNATKVFDSNAQDFSEYINLNPNATIDNKNICFIRQKSVDESCSNTSFHDQKDNISHPISAAGNNRKISMPAFPLLNFGKNSDMGIDTKENKGILSSNPLSNKNIMSNPLMKSNVNISNISSGQNLKKPILVKITGQTQMNTANFKPISSLSDLSEVRSVKPGSPKPVESVLNRQLSGNYKSDVFENSSQNGQEKQSSRPGSVNNKCKKGNGYSGSRPPSVTSQGDVNLGNINRSRPSSVSSEVSSTPTNSRPASVMSERESGSRGLHYASLELDNSSDRSPRPPPTPIAGQSAFSYAQIDFIKSEELKNSKNLSAKSKN